MLESGVIPVSN